MPVDKDTILAAIDRAFGDITRPNTMVRNPNHCDECADHESIMQSVTPQTVTLEEVGNPGWDPVCYLTDDAFCYFMPGLARLALDRTDAYLFQFLFHLDYDQSCRIDAFSREQRAAVADLMVYIGETMLEMVIENWMEGEFDRVWDKLRGTS